MACMFMILSRLGHIQSSPDIMAGLAYLGWLLGVVLRRWPCIRCVKSGCEIRCCSGMVFIIWVLVVLQLVLTVMQAVVYVYNIWLSSRCQAGRPGFKGCLGWHWILSGNGAKQTFFLSLGKANQSIILVLSAKVVQSSTILLLCSGIGSPSSKISFTIKALYIILSIRLSNTKYPHKASLLPSVIPYKR